MLSLVVRHAQKRWGKGSQASIEQTIYKIDKPLQHGRSLNQRVTVGVFQHPFRPVVLTLAQDAMEIRGN